MTDNISTSSRPKTEFVTGFPLVGRLFIAYGIVALVFGAGALFIFAFIYRTDYTLLALASMGAGYLTSRISRLGIELPSLGNLLGCDHRHA